MDILSLFNQKQSLKNLPAMPYIIAEAGVNHEGNMDLAKRLIDEACDAGADAIKFQTYKANTLASKNSPAYWDTTKEPTLSQFELFKKYDTFWKDEFILLKQHCDQAGIEFMSTPFDIESASFLNDLMNVFKISSSDITNKPFIEFICKFKKPILLSTGASDMNEIKEAVSWIEKFGNQLALLHCVLNYPTMDKNAHLGMIVDLKRQFPENIIGYSDHTLPGTMKTCEIATLLGAEIIEKHFTQDKSLPGNDHYHAMDKSDLSHFRKNLFHTFLTIGSFTKQALTVESPARANARRSLVAVHDMKKGHIIKIKNITFKRPASGISPQNIDDIIGKQTITDIKADDIIQWSMFQSE
ncbi:acetylneuraminic acid synthetase [Candidatus Magnetomorum sp. HK-1]|nr:acetylneuraminic acid synthetase [Candidatus Magnetomorum sp. HK-1]